MPSEQVNIDGDVYESFTSNILDKEADTGVFPGVEVKGWNLHELPSETELQSAEVGIELGRTPDVGNLRGFRWQLG